MKRRLAATVLSLQAVVLGLAAPVLIGVNQVDPKLALLVSLGGIALAITAAGLLKSSFGYFLGWLLQFGSIAMGALITEMYVLGTIFLVLWATAVFLGNKIERERKLRGQDD